MGFNPRFLNLIPLVMAGIQSAEALKGAKGAAKKQHVLDLVRIGLAGAETGAGKNLLDDEKVADAADAVIEASVKLANVAKAAGDAAQ